MIERVRRRWGLVEDEEILESGRIGVNRGGFHPGRPARDV
jgi:hypothetical protein